MSDEINAHSLGTDKSDDLFQLIDHRFGGTIEEHVSLIEEEDKLRQFLVTNLRQSGIELCHEPKKERGVEFGIEHQFVSSEDIHYTHSILRINQVFHIECWLSEEFVAPLTLNFQHSTLDGSDAGWRDVTIDGREKACVLPHKVEHKPEVLEVDEQEFLVVSNAEDDVEHTALHIAQPHQSAKQLRSHCRHGGAHGIALLAKYIVESHWTGFELRVGDTELILTFLNEGRKFACLRDAREVALHVCHEARHTCLTESFGKHLQRHGFSGSCCTGNETMTITHFTRQIDGTISAMCDIEITV